MSQSRVLPKVIDGVKEFFASLIAEEYSVYDSDAQKEAEQIAKMQDNDKIDKLVSQMDKVDIPLEDTKSLVEKAKVSEEVAKKKAEQVKAKRQETRNQDENSKTID